MEAEQSTQLPLPAKPYVETYACAQDARSHASISVIGHVRFHAHVSNIMGTSVMLSLDVGLSHPARKVLLL